MWVGWPAQQLVEALGAEPGAVHGMGPCARGRRDLLQAHIVPHGADSSQQQQGLKGSGLEAGSCRLHVLRLGGEQLEVFGPWKVAGGAGKGASGVAEACSSRQRSG